MIFSTNFVNTLIEEKLLDYDNIKQYYDPKYPEDYKLGLFNGCHYENIKFFDQFVQRAKLLGVNEYKILYKLLPSVIDYCSEYELFFTDYIEDGDDWQILTLYALSVADNIINEYEDFVNDIVNNTTAKKIAISKLKRNKLVNEGILLKLSMKNCGMF
mgnify:FL=1|tara:strand:- start:489 stop:962 length:474 start_codon:yes stop_codon:yes gene_type:complete